MPKERSPAPLLAASMIPGPAPVITIQPRSQARWAARASARA